MNITIKSGENFKLAINIVTTLNVTNVVLYFNNKLYTIQNDSEYFYKELSYYYFRLKSSDTKLLTNKNPIIVSVTTTELGVQKTKETDCILFVNSNKNNHSEQIFSQAIDAIFTLEIQNSQLTDNVIITNIAYGLNALQLFRIEKNLPNATIDDVWNYYFDGRTVKYAIEAENGNIYPNPFAPSLVDDGITEIYPFILVTILDGNTLSPRYDVGYEIIDDFKNFKIRTSVIEQINNVLTNSTEYLFLIIERK